MFALIRVRLVLKHFLIIRLWALELCVDIGNHTLCLSRGVCAYVQVVAKILGSQHDSSVVQSLIT